MPVEYDCYADEEVTEKQLRAVENFANCPEQINSSKEKVEAFCHDQLIADDGNENKGNIFTYVKPEYVFVKRDSFSPRVALMCRYRYDPEHGLAVVFQQDGNIVVGLQDIIL